MSKTIGLILALEDKCSPQLNKIADKLGITEKEAKNLHNRFEKLNNNLSKGMKEAAKIAAVGLGAITAAGTALVTKTVEAGDRIDKMSQKMQMSRKTFQELDYVFSQNGANIESMSKGMVKLSKNISDASKGTNLSSRIFEQLGVSVADAEGNLRKTEDVMGDVISSLQKMPDDANRSALATTLFGKSASELAPLLNKDAKSIDELRKKFNALGMGMSDKSINSAVKFRDTMDSINRSLQGAGFEIAGEFLPALQTVADNIITNMPKIKATVVPVLNGILNVTNAVISSMNIWMPVMAGVVAGLGTFKLITGVVNSIKFLKTAIDAVRISQGIWNAVMLANPIGAIAVGVGAVVGGVILLWKNWDKVTAGVRTAFEAIKKVVSLARPLADVFHKSDKVSAGQNKIPKHATGTMFAPGGLSLVGENGPELLNLPRGSQVFNNHETKNMMSKDVTINLNIGGNVIGNDDFIAQVSNALGKQLATALAV